MATVMVKVVAGEEARATTPGTAATDMAASTPVIKGEDTDLMTSRSGPSGVTTTKTKTSLIMGY